MTNTQFEVLCTSLEVLAGGLREQNRLLARIAESCDAAERRAMLAEGGVSGVGFNVRVDGVPFTDLGAESPGLAPGCDVAPPAPRGKRRGRK